MSDLLGCAAFFWCVAIVIGIGLIDHRLDRIAKLLEREEKRRNGGSR